MIHDKHILVLVASVRARRLCPAIAEWVAEVGRGLMPAQFQIVDLAEWELPMNDEPGIPALGEYAFDHTRAWSRTVAEADAFVLVTPQYNWGYPAPLKNALDHLYDEWAGKPALVISYGGHGGGKCARQLRQVLKGLNMKPIRGPGFRLTRDRIKANTGTIDPAVEFARDERALGKAFSDLAARLRGDRRPRWLRFG